MAAAACLVASGLFVGGIGGALAFADPPLETPGLGDDGGVKAEPSQNHVKEGTDPGSGTGKKDGGDGRPNPKPDDQKPDDEKPDGQNPVDQKPVDQKPDDQKPDDGEPDDGEQGQGEIDVTKDPDPPTRTTEVPPPPKDPPEEEGDCDDKSGDDCGPSWWPFPWPWDPGLGQPPDGDVGGGHNQVPSGRPELPPPMQLPTQLHPDQPPVLDADPTVGVAAAQVPLAPITLPVIVAPALGFGGAGGAPAAPVQPVPRGVAPAKPPVKKPPPADMGSNVTVPPSSYRVGYTDYLRTAGMSQLVALAAPGLAGILVLTGAGGLVGYRQAKAGHALRTGGGARFVN